MSVFFSISRSEIRVDTSSPNTLFGNPRSMMRLSESRANFSVNPPENMSRESLERIVAATLSMQKSLKLYSSILCNQSGFNFTLIEAGAHFPDWHIGEVDLNACNAFATQLISALTATKSPEPSKETSE